MTRVIGLLPAIALIGGLTLSIAAAGYAQDQGPPPATGQADRWDPAAMHARMQARRTAQERRLHDALGLHPDQEAAWQAFVTAVQPPDGAHRWGEDHDRGGPRPELTTPERLDRMAKRMQEREARFHQHAEAVKRFYVVLDARQQKTFDALIGARFGRGGMTRG